MSAVLHRNLRTDPPVAVRGEGAYLIDAAGKRYLDASGGAAVSCLGHSHPAVIAAVQAQVAALPYAHSSFFGSEPAERLAEHLMARAPAGFGAGRVAFVGSGSEATEVALKLARQYFLEIGEPRRTRFIARRMSYHGNTLGALAAGGHAGRRAPYAPLLMEVSHVAPCYEYRERHEGEALEAFGQRVADELETEILRLGPETVAAFLAEPVAGAGLGCAPPTPGYLARIRAICDRYGVLFIADEVMCGMGRTGRLFAVEEEGACPDIVTIAKGLGAGYQPVAATLCSGRVAAAIEAGSGALANGHTYMGHPVACAAGLAVLETIEREGLLARVRERGAELRTAVDARFGQHAHVGDIRGRGLFLALEFVADRETKAPFPREARVAERLKAAAMENGLICYPTAGCADGVSGDLVILAPPYTLESEQVEEAVEKLSTSLAGVLP